MSKTRKTKTEDQIGALVRLAQLLDVALHNRGRRASWPRATEAEAHAFMRGLDAQAETFREQVQEARRNLLASGYPAPDSWLTVDAAPLAEIGVEDKGGRRRFIVTRPALDVAAVLSEIKAAILRLDYAPDAQAQGAAPRAAKRRRRPPVEKTIPALTARQTETLQIVGECKGSFAEAGRRMKRDRKTVKQHYDAALAKMKALGLRTPERKLKPAAGYLPENRRGQVDAFKDEDGQNRPGSAWRSGKQSND